MRLLRLGHDSGFVAGRIEVAVDAARRANDAFADFLEVSYLPAAPEADGVGEERYRRAADGFLGLEIDPDEVYAWGWEELHRIQMEMVAVGEQIAPGSSIREVATLLETDPDRCAPTHAEFVDFVSQRQHRALAALDETQFDVPDPIKTVTRQHRTPRWTARRLLPPAQRGSDQSTRWSVVFASRRGRSGAAVPRGFDGLSRGFSRAPSPGRDRDGDVRSPEPVPPGAAVVFGIRGGVGAVHRAADARARVLREARLRVRHARQPPVPHRTGSGRHRLSSRARHSGRVAAVCW